MDFRVYGGSKTFTFFECFCEKPCAEPKTKTKQKVSTLSLQNVPCDARRSGDSAALTWMYGHLDDHVRQAGSQ